MNVFVTGGAGYIGSHICKALAKAHFTPIAIDNLSRGHRWAVKWGPLEVVSIGNAAPLFAKYQPIAVIHCAGLTYVEESVRDPLKYYQNNISETLSFLQASHCPFIFSSTCAIYGMPQKIPLEENHPHAPISPYGVTKATIERLLLDMSHAHSFPYVALRYFNAAGADLDGEIGESHDPETHIIPLLLHTALGKQSGFTLYGTDYPTEDGTAIRDYIHVTDLADAHVLALHYLLKGGKSDAFNLGTGNGYSALQVIDAAKRITGKPIATKNAPRRPGDPPRLVANPAKANQILQWQPRHSDLDTLLQTAWKWSCK